MGAAGGKKNCKEGTSPAGKYSLLPPEVMKMSILLTQSLIKTDCHNHAYDSRRTSVWIKCNQRAVLLMVFKSIRGWVMASSVQSRGSSRRMLSHMGCSSAVQPHWAVQLLAWSELCATIFPWWGAWPSEPLTCRKDKNTDSPGEIWQFQKKKKKKGQENSIQNKTKYNHVICGIAVCNSQHFPGLRTSKLSL